MKLQHLFIILVVLVVSGCATNTSIRQHPEFANAKKSIVKIGLIKPEVVFTEIAADGDNKRLEEKELSLIDIVTDKASQELKNKGYQVEVVELDALEAEYPDVRQDLQTIKDALENAKKNLYEKPATIEESVKFEENLGAEINVFAQLLNLDALLITSYDGWEKTGGSVAVDVAKTVVLAALGVGVVPQFEGESASVALVEAKTGDLLWTNGGYDTSIEGNAVVNALLPLQKQGEIAFPDKKKK